MTFNQLTDAALGHPEHVRRDAAATIAAHALDVTDARELLAMLGLTDQHRPAPERPRRAADRATIVREYRAGRAPTAIARDLGITRAGVWHHLNAAGYRRGAP